MKKFIKELEDRGIMKTMVDSAIITEKITGCPVRQDGMEMILGLRMKTDEDLEDIFIKEAMETAMKSVFEYLQEQISEKKKEQSVEKSKEDEFKESICSLLNDAIEEALGEFKSMMDDGK